MNRLKGMFDIIEDQPYYDTVESAIKTVASRYHILKMDTPILENTDLFHRGMGENTDVVQKETYTFEDRGKRSITLRPEGTAGVVRAFIEHKLYASSKRHQKFYYYGPMFRYERPQKGRFRQFMSFGVEAFGPKSPVLDMEIIASAYDVINHLHIPAKVFINSLSVDAKRAYKDALKAHIQPHLHELCEDCQTRFEDNPLRMLDCKKDRHQPAFKKAPMMEDFLTPSERDHFERLKHGLDQLKIPYEVDPFLVRGLDYYTETVFEIKADEAILGAQNTVCGGGRYDHLVKDLGGPQVEAVGYAFGIERLILAYKNTQQTPPEAAVDVYVLVIGEDNLAKTLPYVKMLRDAGLNVVQTVESMALKGQFKQVAFHQATFTMVCGDDELSQGIFTIKNQITETSFKGHLDQCIDVMKETVHG